MKYYNVRKRGLALFVALMMCLSLLPGTAMAAEAGDICPECGEGTIVTDKGDPNKLICTNCAEFSGTVAKPEEPDVPVHQHTYGEDDRCTDSTCRELNPDHQHTYDETGKCICGEQESVHEHIWHYEKYAGHSARFWHTKYCSCGAKIEEACTTEVVNDPYEGRISKCTLCGYWEPASDQHNWGSWASNEDGTHTRKCTDEGCSEERTEECELAASDDHSSVKCALCGYVKYNDGTPSGGDGKNECPDGNHTYGSVGQSTGEGSHKRQCLNCDYVLNETCSWDILKEDGQPVAHYCTICGNQMSIPNPDKDYCTDLTGGHEWGPKTEVLSEDGKSVLTTLVCKKCGYTEITDICTSPAKVIVHYVYENGGQAAPDAEQAVIAGMEYSITSPSVEGYTPDQAVVSGKCTDGKGAEYKVVYRVVPKEYTLTIKYEKNGGETVFPAYTAKLKAGEEYDVKSETLYGYRVEKDYVKGIMPDADELITVKYEPITYTWTINYVDTEGKKVAASSVKTFTVETVKSLADIPSPEVEGYTFNDAQKLVSPPSSDKLADKVDTVVYTPVDVTPAKYILTIKYEYDDGSEIPGVSDVTLELEAGAPYRVASPVVANYTPEQVAVEGNMPVGGGIITVKYTPVSYTWTIRYVDENGNQLADPFTRSFTVRNFGTLTAQTSPTIDGYTTTAVTVDAPSSLGDKNDVVVYTAVTPETPAPVVYTLTINYVDEDGNPIADPHTEELEAGEEYAIPSPAVEGYTPDQTVVRGAMEEADVTVTVVYTANSVTPGGDGDGEDEPTPTPTPVFPAPDPVIPAGPGADTGIDITDEETPLAGTIGLNDVEHFAYIIGYGDGTVRPLDNITRAEAVTIFFRLMTDEYRTANWSTTNSFADVNAGSWYNNAISTCLKAGALEAFAQNADFLPDQAITRAEFAALAAGFISDEYTGETVGDFSDTEGHWAAGYIRKAVEAGWITGTGNTFRPDEPITRADVMTMVNRMLDRIPDADHLLPGMKTWTDNPEGTSYYEDVQEATNEHAYERDEMGIVEHWTELKASRDWKALENEWAANGGSAAPEAEESEAE